MSANSKSQDRLNAFNFLLALGLCLPFLSCNKSSSSKQDLGKALRDAVYAGEDSATLRLLASGVPVNSSDRDGKTALLRAFDDESRAGDSSITILLDHGADPNLADTSGNTPLIGAVFRGDLNSFRRLLEHGARVNAANHNGFTALHFAANQVRSEMVEELLARQADVNLLNLSGESPLMLLCDKAESASLALAKKLIRLGSSLENENERGRTPLMIAAEWRVPEMVKLLIESGAKVNAKNRWGATALMFTKSEGCYRDDCDNRSTITTLKKYGATEQPAMDVALLDAAKKGSLSGIAKALRQGAKVDARNLEGNTALLECLRGKEKPGAELLIDHGADPDIADPYKVTPLMLAASDGRISLVKKLIGKGASINVQDDDGRSTLDWASHAGDTLLAYLLQNGADVHAKRKDGSTPLMAVAQKGSLSIIKEFLRMGADPDAVSLNGHSAFAAAVAGENWPVADFLFSRKPNPNAVGDDGTPLICEAASNGKEKIIAYLLDHGADPNIPEKFGYRPCHLAAREGRGPVLEILLSHKADVNARTLDGLGSMPIHLAFSYQRPEAVRILLGHGADINARDLQGHTPASITAVSAATHPEMLDIALKAKADFNASDDNGDTPFMLALRENNTELKSARIILPYVKDVNAKDHEGNTALHKLVGKTFIDFMLVLDLIKKHADPQVKNREGKTPIDIAEKNAPHIAQLLKDGTQAGRAWSVFRSESFPYRVEYDSLWETAIREDYEFFVGPDNVNINVQVVRKEKYTTTEALMESLVQQWKTAEGFKLKSESPVAVAGTMTKEVSVRYVYEGHAKAQRTVVADLAGMLYILSYTIEEEYEAFYLSPWTHFLKTFTITKENWRK